jgi:Cu/Ag efflux protein CusF
MRHTIVVGLMLSAFAAAQPAQPARPVGVVTAIDRDAKKITMKTDSGAEMAVLLGDAAGFRRVAPGEKDLKKATEIAFPDVTVGDRILVARGQVSSDQKSVAATLVVVMTKADIARKHESDRAEWQKRGVSGIVSAVNPTAKQVTINVRTAEGLKPLVISLADGVLFRRYAPDSVRFADAKDGTFAEVAVGDQVRALGTRSADGLSFTAEEMVSGAFRNIAGTVISVDVANSTLKVMDLDAKKPLLVKINADSSLRRMQQQLAQMLAVRLNAPAGAPAAGNAPAGGPPRSGGPGGPGGPGGMRGGGMPDFQQMIERMPAFKLEELKAGDALIVAATRGADAGQVTAITLLAGVEPILTTPASRQAMVLGNWSLDMNMGQ